MKKIAMLVVAILLMALPVHAGPLDKKVTLQFNSIDMYVVLARLSNDVGLAFIHDHDGPEPRVTVDARDRSAVSVVDELTEKNKMQYTIAGKALVVGYPRMVQQYRDTTVLVVKYKNLKPQEAATIVQGVFPYVDVTVQPDAVKYVIPKTFLGPVKDIAVSLDRDHKPAPAPTP